MTMKARRPPAPRDGEQHRRQEAATQTPPQPRKKVPLPALLFGPCVGLCPSPSDLVSCPTREKVKRGRAETDTRTNEEGRERHRATGRAGRSAGRERAGTRKGNVPLGVTMKARRPPAPRNGQQRLETASSTADRKLQHRHDLNQGRKCRYLPSYLVRVSVCALPRLTWSPVPQERRSNGGGQRPTHGPTRRAGNGTGQRGGQGAAQGGKGQEPGRGTYLSG